MTSRWGLSALVSHFTVCKGGCSGYDEVRLELPKHMSDLEQGKAVALSYAIGDFDRQKYIIGHFKDQIDRVVSILAWG